MTKLKVGKYYRMNWKWKESQAYGYFKVLSAGIDCYVIEEINPWGGGPWTKTYLWTDIHLKNAEPVPNFKGNLHELAKAFAAMNDWHGGGIRGNNI